MSAKHVYKRLDKKQAALLLVDHQTGLLNLVHDYSPCEFKNNVLALVAIAKYYNLPTILTTSFEKGPNGPLMPEIKAALPKAPYIARPGQINAWDNADFVKAVKKTKRKQLMIAGIVTDVCVAFPALSALEEGYDVFVITDASGTINKDMRDSAIMRIVHAGAQTLSWFAAVSELHRDWRNDATGLAKILAAHVPNYKNLIDSHNA